MEAFMLKRNCLIVALVLFTASIGSRGYAQQGGSSFGISFSGFVKTDVIYDTRQTVNLREGHFLLYPAAELKDRDGADINANPSLNMLSIQTRLLGKITGPDALGAATSGVIEGEFFGHSEGDINGFRLRHAYLSLKWTNTSLLIGQTWHPMFIAEMYPGVVSFNTGVPFQPFSRNPQLRLTHSIGDLKLMAAAVAQRDFQSMGPDATGAAVGSSGFLRNAGVPDMQVQARYGMGKSFVGAGGGYKTLRPRLSTTKGYETDESISSMAAMAFANIDAAPFTIKLEGVWGGNLTDLVMLGGYAVTSVDTLRGIQEYTPMSCYSLWGEVVYGKELELAVFGGYTENLGADDIVRGAYYARGSNIHHVLRVAPRVAWTIGSMRLAAEVEYTAAAYGTVLSSEKAKVENSTEVSNLRLLFAAYYFF